MSSFRPDGWHTVTPRIFTGDVAGLVGFLKVVSNASGEYQAGMPAEIRIGDSIVMISDGGGRRETMPAFLYLYVEDADETYRAPLYWEERDGRWCAIPGVICGRLRPARLGVK